MNEIVTIISTVGFPIAAFLMLAFYIYKVQTAFQKTIENNTLALQKLTDELHHEKIASHEDDNK